MSYAPHRERTPPRSPAELSRRRFTIAVIVGTAIVLPVLLWVMWDLWSGSVNVLRSVPYDYFYDLQARAMFHGHLYLPNGKMGIEAFVHNGRDYTYFGIFPSLIRMPILLVTSRLDGQMTGPSILVAWMLTALFSSLMLWRVRILIRGEALVGRAEAASYGALMATIMGGSVVLYLAATPFVYSEDFAWSVPLTVGSLFALLGVLERPSRGRVVASGLLILCANLDRSPPGWALSIAALLIAGWFALGRGGASNRRWALPLLAVGIVPFLVSSACHLRQVRYPRRPAHGGPGLGHRQRPPPLLPGRQRRQGLQLRLPSQHAVGLSSALRHPRRRPLPVHHPAREHRRGGSTAPCSTRPTPLPAFRPPPPCSSSSAAGAR